MTAEPPKIDNAPGLKWKARAKGQWEAWWRPRRDLLGRGYPKTMHRLWKGIEPTDMDRKWISDRCNFMQNEMLVWGRGGVPALETFEYVPDLGQQDSAPTSAESPKTSSWGGFVYFVTDGVAIKIGHASSPRSRLCELQVSHHVTLSLLHDMPGKLEDEYRIQQRFNHLRIRGEWFRPGQDLLEYIEELRKIPELPCEDTGRRLSTEYQPEL